MDLYHFHIWRTVSHFPLFIQKGPDDNLLYGKEIMKAGITARLQYVLHLNKYLKGAEVTDKEYTGMRAADVRIFQVHCCMQTVT